MNRRASSRVKSIPHMTYEQRKQAKQAFDEMRLKSAQLLDARKEGRRARAKKREEKKRRKEENEIKAGHYQVIKRTEKVRRWHKNAKKQLLTMGPEQIARLLNRA